MAVLESGLFLSGSIKLNQVLGNLLDRPFYPGLGLAPLRTSQLVKLWLLGIRARVFLDAFQPGGRQVQVAAVPILNLDIVLDDLIPLNLLDSLVNA